jgi:hypothetical protein
VRKRWNRVWLAATAATIVVTLIARVGSPLANGAGVILLLGIGYWFVRAD